MKARSLFLGLAVIVFGGIAADIIYNRPYFRGARIVGADGHPEVTQYAQEFADALSVTTHWTNGQRLPEPHFYLYGSDATSPDGRLTLQQHELRNDYHQIILVRGPAPAETVLILQEGDPGSGTSHNWQWSRDSKAVLIYGSGTPAGYDYSNKLALIYLVHSRILYSIDLSQNLSKRIL